MANPIHQGYLTNARELPSNRRFAVLYNGGFSTELGTIKSFKAKLVLKKL